MDTSTATRTAAVPAPRTTAATVQAQHGTDIAAGLPTDGVALRLLPATEQTLLAELRASGLLFLFALVVTVGVAAACQAASSLLA